jgi:hypothetical protein
MNILKSLISDLIKVAFEVIKIVIYILKSLIGVKIKEHYPNGALKSEGKKTLFQKN